MSWITRVRKAIPFIAKKETTPDNLWHKCSDCGQMIFAKEWQDNLSVCPKCDHHGRIGPKARFEQIFDAGSFKVLPTPSVKEDPLKFRDSKKYTDRIKAARNSTGEQDALINAYGAIETAPVVIGVQDFAYMGGSMGMGVGAAFIQGVEEAIKRKCPYVIFTAAGGARMQEGILSLMQMPRATVAIQRLHAAGLPYIVVLTDPTTGGVTASYAMLGDIQIAEPRALIGFAGQRVIENTIREKLPEGFQRAEYLLEHGMIDMVVHRNDMRATLSKVIGYLCPSKAAA
ncbi:acetyl-CoA carboxylase, carboxyltransferase subunit beta [Rhizorhapis suberifaciens]|uniref:Acetyl-coenzyme A carboxylase carboxyl transferase subunit beta n=1 Tax=Rhizorhapis suberifaciens TaxID=13656 RepID=A0A840HXB8_9SPHN|nr:acetyl-CoA carboxylase, carboxyltransferase subunit beta [Rhizorhapis suberifaciens]MBB4642044.1 acetyl-CoA carboxylase carboxyl transferase subunit beta [Rhizorhapis suberifaciens]